MIIKCLLLWSPCSANQLLLRHFGIWQDANESWWYLLPKHQRQHIVRSHTNSLPTRVDYYPKTNASTNKSCEETLTKWLRLLTNLCCNQLPLKLNKVLISWEESKLWSIQWMKIKMEVWIQSYPQHTFNLNSTDEFHGTGKQSAFEEGFGGTNLTNEVWLGLEPLRR